MAHEESHEHVPAEDEDLRKAIMEMREMMKILMERNAGWQGEGSNPSKHKGDSGDKNTNGNGGMVPLHHPLFHLLLLILLLLLHLPLHKGLVACPKDLLIMHMIPPWISLNLSIHPGWYLLLSTNIGSLPLNWRILY